MLSEVELERRFGSYKNRPKGAPSNAPLHRDFRQLFKQLVGEVDAWLPEGRYKDLALTELEQASMWAHKSIEMDV